jgi:L-lactate dehydrogenase
MISSHTRADALDKKIAIIGAGYVGASVAYAITLMGITQEIVLIEHPDALAKCIAEVNDIRHGIPLVETPRLYSGSYSDIKDSDLIIITAGRNRRPGETRLELTADNVKTASQVADGIAKPTRKAL